MVVYHLLIENSQALNEAMPEYWEMSSVATDR